MAFPLRAPVIELGGVLEPGDSETAQPGDRVDPGAGPALAAGDKPFFSLANTDFIVTLGFLLFIGVLVYFKVPGMITGIRSQGGLLPGIPTCMRW